MKKSQVVLKKDFEVLFKGSLFRAKQQAEGGNDFL